MRGLPTTAAVNIRLRSSLWNNRVPNGVDSPADKKDQRWAKKQPKGRKERKSPQGCIWLWNACCILSPCYPTDTLAGSFNSQDYFWACVSQENNWTISSFNPVSPGVLLTSLGQAVCFPHQTRKAQIWTHLNDSFNGLSPISSVYWVYAWAVPGLLLSTGVWFNSEQAG